MAFTLKKLFFFDFKEDLRAQLFPGVRECTVLILRLLTALFFHRSPTWYEQTT